jgi:hypothetical protein
MRLSRARRKYLRAVVSPERGETYELFTVEGEVVVCALEIAWPFAYVSGAGGAQRRGPVAKQMLAAKVPGNARLVPRVASHCCSVALSPELAAS